MAWMFEDYARCGDDGRWFAAAGCVESWWLAASLAARVAAAMVMEGKEEN